MYDTQKEAFLRRIAKKKVSLIKEIDTFRRFYAITGICQKFRAP